MTPLDKDLADQLSQVPKVINDDLRWKTHNNCYRLRARVLAPSLNEVLELRGNIGKTNYGFILLFQQIPIRRYDNSRRKVNLCHRIPDGTVLRGPHKHTWDLIYQDMPAYIPTDIDPEADLNEQFFQFLNEVHIQLVGTYQHIIIGPFRK